MLAYLNQPPDPQVVGDGWRQAWLERLDDAKPFIEPWLSHQRRDAYWQQGSACEDYGAIRCPVFAVGGWSDGYRDMVLRIVEHVSGPVRGLIGPWGHTSPESGAPGPAIGFLQECVRFFAASLDGADNGFFDEPRLISYMQEPVAPAGSYAERPGRWVADPSLAVAGCRRVDAHGRRASRCTDAAAGSAASDPQRARPAGDRASTAAYGAVTAARRDFGARPASR